MSETTHERVALKEWASVVSAIGSGDQVILLRKGGLADRTFGVKSPRFLLMPTYLHQTENQFHPRHASHLAATLGRTEEEPMIDFSVWCEVVRAFEVRELDRLLRLAGEVIFTDDTIRARYSFRPDQAVHVIAVRAFRLPQVRSLPNQRKYGGCKSWISLDEEVGLDGSVQALAEESLQLRIATIAQALGAEACISERVV